MHVLLGMCVHPKLPDTHEYVDSCMAVSQLNDIYQCLAASG